MVPGMVDDGLLPPGYDELVESSTDIDRFCSSSDWVVPTHRTWGAGPTWRAAVPGAALVLSRLAGPGGAAVWGGLDPVWGFACPALGPDSGAVADLALTALGGRSPRWDAVLVTGLVPGSEREATLRAVLARRHRLGAGPAITRQRARLDDGVAAYLGRRSARFRRNLARAERARRESGVEIELLRGGGAEVVERCRRVELRSWKGRRGGGLAEASMDRFYRVLADRLAPTARLRAGFARWGGRDVGYILGAVRGATYRGLQLSFDEDQAGRSLGNLLQLHQMEGLVEEGVTTYDLGMDMEYKRRWADEAFTTVTVAVLSG